MGQPFSSASGSGMSNTRLARMSLSRWCSGRPRVSGRFAVGKQAAGLAQAHAVERVAHAAGVAKCGWAMRRRRYSSKASRAPSPNR